MELSLEPRPFVRALLNTLNPQTARALDVGDEVEVR